MGYDYGDVDDTTDGGCPPVQKCEFFGSQVDDQMISWTREADGFGWGDPHFKTLDGRTFNIYNSCQYYMLEFQQLTVIGQFAGINWGIAQVKSILVQMGSRQKIYLGQNGALQFWFLKGGRWQKGQFSTGGPKELQVGGVQKTGAFIITRKSGDAFDIECSNGALIRWGWRVDGNRYPAIWEIKVPEAQKGKGVTSGLLGNFNGDPNDDCMLLNKQVVDCPPNFASLDNEYLQAWRVDPKDSCSPDKNDPFNFEEDFAKMKVTPLQASLDKCNVIKKAPFGPNIQGCYNDTVLSTYQSDCAVDYENGDNDAVKIESVCDTLQVIASDCRGVVPEIVNFRDVVPLCPVPSCPEGQVFKTCVTQCDLFCDAFIKLNKEQCGSRCIAGCACENPDHRLNIANTCVHTNVC